MKKYPQLCLKMQSKNIEKVVLFSKNTSMPAHEKKKRNYLQLPEYKLIGLHLTDRHIPLLLEFHTQRKNSER